MAIRMRRGNEADFDPSKMLPGEWAVSTDTKYVRMCFSPGIVLRMATYEAFESDMAEIRKILSQCQNIQTAVELIQKNVTNSELVIENYVKEAKQYRDEAEQFRNEAFATTPEGYEDLVKNVSDNTVKIDTVLEKAGLKFDNTVKGSNIHLTDSAESNVVALELYGKTEQNAYTGKNLLDCSKLTETTKNNVTFKPVYENGMLQYINVNGTASAGTSYGLGDFKLEGEFIASNLGGSYLKKSDGTWMKTIGEDESISIPAGSGNFLQAIIFIQANKVCNNLKYYPMISVEGGEWEPYVGGKPSPNPSYPQEIKSVKGKNLLDCRGLTEQTTNGITFTPVYDENGNLLYVNVNGTASANTNYVLCKTPKLSSGKLIMSGCPNGAGTETYYLQYSSNVSIAYSDNGGGIEVTEMDYNTYPDAEVKIQVRSGYTANNIKFYPMIRLSSITDATYVPYGLLRIKTNGKDFLDDDDLLTWYKKTGSNVYRKVFKLKPNTDYTISQVINSHEGLALVFAISGSDLDFSPNTINNGVTTENKRIVTSDADGYITVGMYKEGKGYCHIYKTSETSEITLSEPIELNGFNGVYDVVTSDGVTRRFAEVRVLSSFDWGVSGGDAGADGHCFQTRMYSELFAKNTNEYVLTNALCTHFIIKKASDLYFKSSDEIGDGIAIWQNTNGYNVIRCRNTDCSSLDEFKTWLDENEVYLVYELATPTTEELQTDFTALKTFYPETHVSNDADCDMSITYTADAKNYIDNKIALLTTAIYNNI